MREIKFRLWLKPHASGQSFFSGEMRKPETLVKLITDDWYNFDASRFEIMQSTGLLEKNGKEIYEGDIIRHSNHGISEVLFTDGSFMFQLNSDTDANGWLEFSQDSFGNEAWEVVGNIYENPELLK